MTREDREGPEDEEVSHSETAEVDLVPGAHLAYPVLLLSYNAPATALSTPQTEAGNAILQL